MDSLKRSYYVDISNGEILEKPIDGSTHFKIFANEEELDELKMWFTENYNDDLKTFVRAHVPYLEPQKASQNDKYESSMNKIYSMLYKLGDEESRLFIEQQGILDLDPQEPREDIRLLKE